MANIKCRAWVQSFKKYLPVVELRFYKGELKTVEVWNKGYIAVDVAGVDLELSTGLKDKNDREIYEGDITKDDNDFVYKIAFEEKMLRWCGIEANTSRGTGLYKINNLGVIGNIHENSELLEDVE